jgi:hypothetical protein
MTFGKARGDFGKKNATDVTTVACSFSQVSNELWW